MSRAVVGDEAEQQPSSNDLQNLKLHRPSRRFDLDVVADVRFEQRLAHRTVDRNVGHVAVRVRRAGFPDNLHQLLGFIVQIEQLLPDVEQAVASSDFGKDAIGKAKAVVERARAAIGKKDVSAVREQIEGLARTQRMFKGVVAKAP
jgi:hypothetical protein